MCPILFLFMPYVSINTSEWMNPVAGVYSGLVLFLLNRRNIPSDRDPSYLKKCTYDPVKDPYCPIIKLGTIVKEAGEDYKTLAYKVNFFRIVIIIIAFHTDRLNKLL